MSEISRWNFENAWPSKVSSRIVKPDLKRRGLSADGERQFLAGEVVTQLSDRQRLVQILTPALGLGIGERTSAVAMLLPAVQSARAARKKMPSNLNLTAVGAAQFLAFMPVTNPGDRAVLLAALDVALGN